MKKNDKVTDEKFIQPVVITVKKDRSVKTALALDARSLNNAILTIKCQLPNLVDSLIEKVAEIVNATKEGERFFSSLDM